MLNGTPSRDHEIKSDGGATVNFSTTLKDSFSELQEFKYALDQTAIVAITDLAGRIIYVNDKFLEISKYSREELMGRTHQVVNSGYHTREFFMNLWQTIIAGKIWRGEIKNKTKDGNFYWVYTTIIPFTKGSAKPYQFVSIRVDITEKKRSEEIREQERTRREYLERLAALGEMAADIGHEIKNPLTAIFMKSQMMKKSMSEDGVPREIAVRATDGINRGVRRIEKIIQSVKGLARNGNEDPFEATSLKALIDETLEFARPRFIHGQVDLVLGEIPEQMKIKCRPDQISQVLINLLNNGFDAAQSSPEKWVRLEVKEQGSRVVISVTNSGAGIPIEIREKIMEPFFTTKGKTNGTGLGLSISKGILEIHGGTLKIDGTNPHTSFLVNLPKPPESPNGH